jgi:hypothetical protein
MQTNIDSSTQSPARSKASKLLTRASHSSSIKSFRSLPETLTTIRPRGEPITAGRPAGGSVWDDAIRSIFYNGGESEEFCLPFASQPLFMENFIPDFGNTKGLKEANSAGTRIANSADFAAKLGYLATGGLGFLSPAGVIAERLGANPEIKQAARRVPILAAGSVGMLAGYVIGAVVGVVWAVGAAIFDDCLHVFDCCARVKDTIATADDEVEYPETESDVLET